MGKRAETRGRKKLEKKQKYTEKMLAQAKTRLTAMMDKEAKKKKQQRKRRKEAEQRKLEEEEAARQARAKAKFLENFKKLAEAAKKKAMPQMGEQEVKEKFKEWTLKKEEWVAKRRAEAGQGNEKAAAALSVKIDEADKAIRH